MVNVCIAYMASTPARNVIINGMKAVFWGRNLCCYFIIQKQSWYPVRCWTLYANTTTLRGHYFPPGRPELLLWLSLFYSKTGNQRINPAAEMFAVLWALLTQCAVGVIPADHASASFSLRGVWTDDLAREIFSSWPLCINIKKLQRMKHILISKVAAECIGANQRHCCGDAGVWMKYVDFLSADCSRPLCLLDLVLSRSLRKS